jgi:hypothetical protein
MNKKNIWSLIWRILVFILIILVDITIQIVVMTILHRKEINAIAFSGLWFILYYFTLKVAFYYLFEKKYHI